MGSRVKCKMAFRRYTKCILVTCALTIGIVNLAIMMSYPVLTGDMTLLDLTAITENKQIVLVKRKTVAYLNENDGTILEQNSVKDIASVDAQLHRVERDLLTRQLRGIGTPANGQLDEFIASVEEDHTKYELNKTAFGKAYRLSKDRMPTYDFPYIISANDICKDVTPFLLIMVLSVHTHIDTRETIRQTWGRSTKPGVWPKLGAMNDTVRLVFLLGRGNKEIKNKIIEDEHITYGDIMQADFIDSYYNLTLKVVSGLRWVAQFCPSAKYILKADEDVFVHIPNLVNMLKKEKYLDKGSVYGHVNNRPAVFREGKWGVTLKTYPLDRYPSYTSGNTYVISGNVATKMFYVAGHLPYMNIEDAFVCGIVRSFIGGQIVDVRGFTHWYERKPRPCEFKNTIRISSTKTDDSLKQYIWDVLKTNAKNCYYVVHRNNTEAVKRPENHMQNRPSFRHSIRDEHIFFNKTSGTFYVI